jgi:hypothetical protein
VEICANIGPRERRRRNFIGVAGVIFALLVLSALLETRAPRLWRLTLALPAYVAALGFLQARHQTCVGFARKNIRVMGDDRSKVDSVQDATMRARIAAQVRKVYVQTGIAVTAILLLALAIP